MVCTGIESPRDVDLEDLKPPLHFTYDIIGAELDTEQLTVS